MSMDPLRWQGLESRIRAISSQFWQAPLHLLYIRAQDQAVWDKLYESGLKLANEYFESPLSPGEQVLLFSACCFYEAGWQLPDSLSWTLDERGQGFEQALVQNDVRFSQVASLPAQFLLGLSKICTAVYDDVTQLPLSYYIDDQSPVRLRYIAAILQLANLLLVRRIKQIPKVNFDIQGDSVATGRIALGQYVNWDIVDSQIVIHLTLHSGDQAYEDKIIDLLLEPIWIWLKEHHKWIHETMKISLAAPVATTDNNPFMQSLMSNTYADWILRLIEDFEPSGIGEEMAEIPPREAKVRNQIFISYAHGDGTAELEELTKRLKPLTRKGAIPKSWSDKMIKASETWHKAINEAIVEAKIAILLITPDFWASDFIAENELKPIYEAHRNNKLKIIAIACSSTNYELYDEYISTIQWVNDPNEPLDLLAEGERKREWTKIIHQIFEAFEDK